MVIFHSYVSLPEGTCTCVGVYVDILCVTTSDIGLQFRKHKTIAGSYIAVRCFPLHCIAVAVDCIRLH